MFAGKTTALKNSLRTQRIACAAMARRGRPAPRCAALKHASDVERKGAGLVTHADESEVDVLAVSRLADAAEHVADASYVFCDEGQWFEDLAEWCVRWARQGKHVFVAALDADAQGRMWPSVVALQPNATHVERFAAACALCGGVATRTRLRADAPPAKSPTSPTAAPSTPGSAAAPAPASGLRIGQVERDAIAIATPLAAATPVLAARSGIRVGGAETYEAVCIHCL